MTKQNKIQLLVYKLIEDLKPLAEYGPNYSRDAKAWLNINSELIASPWSAYEIVQGFAILRARKKRFQTYSRMTQTFDRLSKYLS